ncbi:MAG: hypothetical protein IPJ48_15305 [Propionivibrio sp.]|uniref:Uncharacterized protein n=1 Tax=Candidatus Propionivibrio dominans TaxID=2954373 RepID=A0A9D7F8X2_9RHOO|nr:hypothetical protein [Candidatus Propionivibrio dominans]
MFHAYLAHSTNQEAWDVAIPHADKATQYVQVKIYDSADHAVKMMQDVHRKVELGTIHDGGNVVDRIDFAVNEDIFDAVRAKAALHSELNGMHVYSIPVSDNTVTNVVVDGFNNVGPDELANLFGQWFGGTLTVACLHAMAQAFLVYKGAKTAAAAREAFELAHCLVCPRRGCGKRYCVTARKTNVMFLSGHPVIAAIAAGMIARAMAKRWYESRESMAAALNVRCCTSNCWFEVSQARITVLPLPKPKAGPKGSVTFSFLALSASVCFSVEIKVKPSINC